MKTVTYLRGSTPTNPELGYGDHVEVTEDGKEIYGGHCSTCPNPYRMDDRGRPIPWQRLYGIVAIGEYTWECFEHARFGKCLRINRGLRVPSERPNPAHDGAMYLTGVYCHVGALNCSNEKWRGSKGCFTHPRDEWPLFIGCFKPGESGLLILRPLIESR